MTKSAIMARMREAKWIIRVFSADCSIMGYKPDDGIAIRDVFDARTGKHWCQGKIQTAMQEMVKFADVDDMKAKLNAYLGGDPDKYYFEWDNICEACAVGHAYVSD